VQSARRDRAGREADKAAEVASPTAAVQQTSQAVQAVGAEQAGQGTIAEGGVMAGDLGMVAVKIGMPPQDLDSAVTGGCGWVSMSVLLLGEGCRTLLLSCCDDGSCISHA
jgi:hypothetical protein